MGMDETGHTRLDRTGCGPGGGLCYIISLPKYPSLGTLNACMSVCGMETRKWTRHKQASSSSKTKKKGLADGAGLDVGIWFNFKLIFPQQAPLALPRA